MENKKYDLSLDCFMNFFSNEIIHLLMYCFCNMNRECSENHSFFFQKYIRLTRFSACPPFLTTYLWNIQELRLVLLKLNMISNYIT